MPFVSLVLVAAGAGALSPDVLLVLAPAFLLLGLLVMGQAPGEDLLLRLAHRPRARRVAPAVARPSLPLLVRRTGRLIASALAMRPPPAAVAISLR